uniref:RING-type domain-containing protein n=1 Tax=Salmo trutta TaxID=8032 RepID=A0A674EMQ9_SALTR
MIEVGIDDLTCPICCETFKEPVPLSCSHSFCRPCLGETWREQRGTKDCAICRRRSSRDHPPTNLALRSIYETLLGFFCLEDECGVCSLHSQKLGFFCLEDECGVCSLHSQKLGFFCLEDECGVCSLHSQKEELQTPLKALQDKMVAVKNTKLTMDEMYKTMKTAESLPQEPYRASGALVDMAKHLGNLKFQVWEKMQEIHACGSDLLEI